MIIGSGIILRIDPVFLFVIWFFEGELEGD